MQIGHRPAGTHPTHTRRPRRDKPARNRRHSAQLGHDRVGRLPILHLVELQTRVGDALSCTRIAIVAEPNAHGEGETLDVEALGTPSKAARARRKPEPWACAHVDVTIRLVRAGGQ